MKKIEVNGIEFEVVTSQASKDFYISLCESVFPVTSVYEAYEKPSKTKVEIETEWKAFASEIGAIGFRIPSHNSSTFTVAFESYKIDGIVDGWFYITKGHNRFIPR